MGIKLASVSITYCTINKYLTVINTYYQLILFNNLNQNKVEIFFLACYSISSFRSIWRDFFSIVFIMSILWITLWNVFPPSCKWFNQLYGFLLRKCWFLRISHRHLIFVLSSFLHMFINIYRVRKIFWIMNRKNTIQSIDIEYLSLYIK